MNLHLTTLLWFMGLTSFTMAAAVLIVGSRSRSDDGLLHWGASLACHGLSYPLFGLRLLGWLDLSIVLSCIATSLTLALNIRAVALFQRKLRPPPGALATWLPVVATGLVAWLAVHQHPLRNVLLSVITGSQAAVLAALAIHSRAMLHQERSRILLVVGSLSLVLLLFVRAIVIVGTQDWAVDLGVPVDVQAVTYLIALMILLFNTVGFLLMQKDKAVEVQHAQATHDPLTGIYNRRALMEELQKIIDASIPERRPVSMLMIDIDHFKRVNDSYGHLVGDEVLGVVCQRIKHRLRQGDLFARFGGEEFVVVLPDTKAHDARGVAEAIREVVAAGPIEVGAVSIPVTISIGVHTVRVKRGEGVIDRMIAACDAALYRAKDNGRNRVEEQAASGEALA